MFFQDDSALVGANRILSICFIVAIFVVNFYLIIKTLRTDRSWYQLREMTFISLALGDIILALFPLVVSAKTAFTLDTPCSTLLPALVYQFHIVHFVFCVGLLVLAGELVYRYRKKSNVNHSKRQQVISIFLTSLPWLLGLVVVLPLTLAGAYCEIDTETSHFAIANVMCVVLPATLVVLTCSIVVCCGLPSPSYIGHVISYPMNGSTSHIAVTQNSFSVVLQNKPDLNAQTFNNQGYIYPISNETISSQSISGSSEDTQGQGSAVSSAGHGHYTYISHANSFPAVLQSQPGHSVETLDNQGYIYPISDQTTSSQSMSSTQEQGSEVLPVGHGRYNRQLLPDTGYQQLNQSSLEESLYETINVYSEPEAVDPTQPLNNPSTSTSNLGKEKTLLLLASVVNIICIVPLAVLNCVLFNYSMAYFYSYHNWLSTWLHWQSVLRSVVTPLIWILLLRK